MNAFNRGAYGAIGKWMHRVVAGVDLDPKEHRYEHIPI